MREKQRRYKFGDYILRERKGRYYVYKLEYEDGNAKERYIGPLADVVQTYEKLKSGVLGGTPLIQGSSRGLNPGPLGPQPSALPS